MTSYYVLAYLHILFTILLVGYALFWVIMALALAREEAPPATTRLLGVINAGRWPPGGVPYARRLPFPVLGWAFLAALAVSGTLLLARIGHPVKPALLGTKLALFGLLLFGQALATRRPTPPVAFLNGVCALTIVLVSALFRR